MRVFSSKFLHLTHSVAVYYIQLPGVLGELPRPHRLGPDLVHGLDGGLLHQLRLRAGAEPCAAPQGSVLQVSTYFYLYNIYIYIVLYIALKVPCWGNIMPPSAVLCHAVPRYAVSSCRVVFTA